MELRRYPLDASNPKWLNVLVSGQIGESLAGEDVCFHFVFLRGFLLKANHTLAQEPVPHTDTHAHTHTRTSKGAARGVMGGAGGPGSVAEERQASWRKSVSVRVGPHPV